jgi:hypothetical protein
MTPTTGIFHCCVKSLLTEFSFSSFKDDHHAFSGRDIFGAAVIRRLLSGMVDCCMHTFGLAAHLCVTKEVMHQGCHVWC